MEVLVVKKFMNIVDYFQHSKMLLQWSAYHILDKNHFFDFQIIRKIHSK